MATVLEKILQRLPALTSREQVMEMLLEVKEAWGFDWAYFLNLQENFHRYDVRNIPHFSNYPTDFVEDYITRNYLDIDPVVRTIWDSASPFLWHDVTSMSRCSPEEIALLAEVKERGLSDGLAIPLFGPRGAVGYAGFAMERGSMDISPQEIRTLQHIVYHLYTAYLEREGAMPAATLSPREKEVLTWVAAGKSNQDIGTILSISEHTVDSLLRRAFRKLDVTSRVAAVVKAAQRGLIVT